MHYSMMTHQCQRGQHLSREPPDKNGRKASKAISFYQFVQIDAEKLHHNAKMLSEVEMFYHLDNMVLLFRILERNHRREYDPEYHKETYPFTKIV
jgi:hypothetical protein